MNGDFIELYDWAAWKFGAFEYRLCGYIYRDGNLKCIVTEPIMGVNLEEGYVETTNNLKFKLGNPIEEVKMIDMSYVLDRWMNLNGKGQPWKATDMVLEALGRLEKKE